MPRCSHCGGLVTLQDENCPKCGAMLERPAAPPTVSPEEEPILALLRQGQKIEAIKAYRENTGLGLKEAKDAVEALATEHGIATASGCGQAAVIFLTGALVGCLLLVAAGMN